MDKPYLHHDVVKNAQIIKATADSYLFCDTYNHYVLTPDAFTLQAGCSCKLATTSIVRVMMARPRFEVYNKDPDFLWDHECDTLFQVKKSGSGKADPADFVEYILVLLNRMENQKLLAVAAKRHRRVPHELP